MIAASAILVSVVVRAARKKSSGSTKSHKSLQRSDNPAKVKECSEFGSDQAIREMQKIEVFPELKF